MLKIQTLRWCVIRQHSCPNVVSDQSGHTPQQEKELQAFSRVQKVSVSLQKFEIHIPKSGLVVLISQIDKKIYKISDKRNMEANVPDHNNNVVQVAFVGNAAQIVDNFVFEPDPNGNWRRRRLVRMPNGTWRRIGRLTRINYQE